MTFQTGKRTLFSQVRYLLNTNGESHTQIMTFKILNMKWFSEISTQEIIPPNLFNSQQDPAFK